MGSMLLPDEAVNLCPGTHPGTLPQPRESRGLGMLRHFGLGPAKAPAVLHLGTRRQVVRVLRDSWRRRE